MTIINLTSNIVEVYKAYAFTGLKQINKTTFVADTVCTASMVVSFPVIVTGGARIEQRYTAEVGTVSNTCVPLFETFYGDAVGIPTGIKDGDTLIVSHQMMEMLHYSGHRFAVQCVSPYQVVRSAIDPSIVFGCMGFSKKGL